MTGEQFFNQQRSTILPAKFHEEGTEQTLGTYYSDILNYEHPSEPTKVLSLPEHGIIERVPFSVAVPISTPST